ncbi:MAG: hypothetical protein OK474_07980 [Thaumarchaeota archaeon]|nr:hypothetical protein [Nitrososphaerota archaeon]
MTTPPYPSRREAVSKSVEEAFVPLSSVRTIQSKFLDKVKVSAEERYLELLVDLKRPNAGYGYIQKRDGFSNLYVFRFEFNSTYASFYLGSGSNGSLHEERRTVELAKGEGAEMGAVLAAIQNGIDEAAKRVIPSLGALERTDARRMKDPVIGGPGLGPNGEETSWATIRHADPTGRKAASRVWTQGQEAGARRMDREQQRSSSSGPGRALILVAVAIVLFLLFAPIVATQSAPPDCVGTSCPAHPTHYASATSLFLGVGGVYLPPGEGWTPHSFIGSQDVGGGTVVEGFGVSYYYFAL